MEFDRLWSVKKYLPERRGQFCKILKTATMKGISTNYIKSEGFGWPPRNFLVQFEDGFQVITNWRCIVKRQMQLPF